MGLENLKKTRLHETTCKKFPTSRFPVLDDVGEERMQSVGSVRDR